MDMAKITAAWETIATLGSDHQKIAGLVGDGYSISEIAANFKGRPCCFVKACLSQIYEQVPGVSCRLQLAIMAYHVKMMTGEEPGAPPPKLLPELLTKKQLAVAGLLSEGRTNKEIAAILCMSEETTKKHISTICDKLGFSNRTEIALRVLQERYSRIWSSTPSLVPS